MRYQWDWIFSSRDRKRIVTPGGITDLSVGDLIDWHEEEEKKFMTEHQNDNQSFSNN